VVVRRDGGEGFRTELDYQGRSAGEGDHTAECGGKADIMLNADLGKLGL